MNGNAQIERFHTAADVALAFQQVEAFVGTGLPNVSPTAFLSDLKASRRPFAAVAFCAFLLTRRDAVTWLCRSLRSLPAPVVNPGHPALAAAEAWIEAADEPARLHALRVGQSFNANEPEPWAALAAGWSGGNLVVGEHPGAPAPAHLTAQAACAGLSLAFARLPMREWHGRIEACVADAVELAVG